MDTHNLTMYTLSELEARFDRLQGGPTNPYSAAALYCSTHEDCPWNSLDAIEAELVKRDMAVAR